MAEALKGVYRPRNPQATPFYQLVEDHGERLTEGRGRLVRYIIRPPVSLERLTYDREGQQVFYKAKSETYTYQPLDFLAGACPERSEG